MAPGQMKPMVPSSPKEDDDLRKASLTRMPREILDIIFSYVLVSPNCVSYVDGKGVQVYDNGNIQKNMRVLASNGAMAQTLCEAFYQCNTFRLYDYQLSEFLSLKQHKSATINDPLPKAAPRGVVGSRYFEVMNWVKKLIVRTHINRDGDVSYVNFSGGENLPTKHLYRPMEWLRPLLECPRLASVILDIECRSKSLPELQDEQVMILSALREKLGDGLQVFCDMGWSYGNPGTSSDWRLDISGRFSKQRKKG